jgi:hypothetical protein
MKRLYSFILLLALAFAVPAFAQQRWERTYGGTSNDWGYSVQQTSDGGFIVAGYSGSFGNGYQVYLIKTDTSGDTLWTRTYGGFSTEWGYSVQQTPDGGYIIGGRTSSFGAGGNDVYLIKTNAAGDTLWTRTYGGRGYDEGTSVQQTSDGGYIISGTSDSYSTGDLDVYLIKTDASGDTLWARVYGSWWDEDGLSVQQTSDGGYIIAGWTWASSPSNYDFYLIKTNPSGDTLWTKKYGGSGNDEANCIKQTSDGGFIIVGFTSSYGAGSFDNYLIKTDAQGDTLWTRTYGGTNDDYGLFVQQTSDSGYIIAGYTSSFGAGGYDVYLIKTNKDGDTLWTKTYGGTGDDEGWSVQQTSDEGYIIAGTTTSFGAGGYDVYLIKTDANGNVGVEVSPSRQSRVTSYGVFPNPFTSFTSVQNHEADRFALYDVSGRRVGTYRGDRIGEGLQAGVYFVRAEGGGAKPVRIVKVR